MPWFAHQYIWLESSTGAVEAGQRYASCRQEEALAPVPTTTPDAVSSLYVAKAVK